MTQASRKIIISPSLLSADFLHLAEEIERFKNCQNLWLHLDVMDGHFVPNLTFGPTVLKGINKFCTFPLDAHFMVENPEDHAHWFKDVGLTHFTFHWEAIIHHDRFLTWLKSQFPSVGVSLNPSTPLHVIPDYLWKKMDLLLLMSVNPGFGGQSFIPAILDKVKEAREKASRLNPQLMIQVDGGVTTQNSHSLIQAGADNLVAGTAVFGEPQKNYALQVEKLRTL
jgi:ribulose-phosphate 3-epimerase